MGDSMGSALVPTDVVLSSEVSPLMLLPEDLFVEVHFGMQLVVLSYLQVQTLKHIYYLKKEDS